MNKEFEVIIDIKIVNKKVQEEKEEKKKEKEEEKKEDRVTIIEEVNNIPISSFILNEAKEYKIGLNGIVKRVMKKRQEERDFWEINGKG